MPKQVVLRKKRRSQPVAKRRTTPQEMTALARALRQMGSVIGSSGGAMLGSPSIGATIGSSLGGALSKWLGAGDYAVASNTVVQRNLSASRSIPSMHNDSQSIIVRHKEYLGEVRSATAYTVQQSFPINPGIPQTFPWLSGIATRFQEYTIRGAVFHYIPSSGAAVSSTNAALGTVMLQTSYRATDAPPASKVEMLNEYCSNEVVPSDTMAHPIECDPKENPFNVQYVRSGAVPSGESTLLYDLGQTHLAVSGCQTNGNVIGDLWITYEVELRKPLVASNVTAAVISGVADAVTPSNTNPLGSTLSTFVGSLSATMTGNTITFGKGQVGKYVVATLISGNTLALAFPGAIANNCTTASIQTGVLSSWVNISGSSLCSLLISIVISDPTVTPTLTLPFGGSGTYTATRVVITEQA